MPNIKALDLPVSEMKNFEVGLPWSLFQLVTPGAGPVFDSRGIIQTNLKEVYKEMPHTKYQCSRTYSSRKKNFGNELPCSYSPRHAIEPNFSCP